MPYLSVLLTDITVPFVANVLITCGERSTYRATSLAFTNWLTHRGTLLVNVETRAAPKLSVTLGARNSDVWDGARRALHIDATRLVALECNVTCARFVASFTHIFHHRACHISNHMIVSFEIIVQWVDSFNGVAQPFEKYFHTPGLFRE